MRIRLLDFNTQMQSKTNEFQVQLYGIDSSGQSVAILVNDYRPFFFIMGDDTWNESILSSFMDCIYVSLGKKNLGKMTGTFHHYNKLYGFSGGKTFPFIKLEFIDTYLYYSVKKLWNEKGIITSFLFGECPTYIYESGIPPLLRFFHITQISPSGWVEIQQITMVDCYFKTTTCALELRCLMKDILPVEDDSMVPYKICSFDIEASSSHGDFPVPKKTYFRLSTSIIDTYKIHRSIILRKNASNVDVDVDVEKESHRLFYDILKASFGIGRFEGIVPVYLKEPLLEETFDRYFDKLYNTTLEISANTKASILNEQQFMNPCILADVMMDIDMDTELSTTTIIDYGESYDAKKSTSSKKLVLLSKLHSMESDDVKIEALNEALTSVFPEICGDEVTFIGSIFMRYGEDIPYLNHCLVVNTCDAVEGVDIHSYSSESEILQEWTNLIKRENPDIIIGYNIFGFDYEFMYQRAKELGCSCAFLDLSRIREPCEMTNKKTVFATGEFDLKYPLIIGRLQIDMYTYFRRDIPMASYKLDDVVGQYICDEIYFIKASIEKKGIIELYTKNIHGLHQNDYINIELGGFTTTHYMKGKKFEVVHMEKNKKILDSDNVTYNVIFIESDMIQQQPKMKWCITKDDVSPHQIFEWTKGSSSDRAKIAKYCIQDCNLVMHLFTKIDVLTSYIEMSSICSVPMSFLVFRGQGIKLTSYVAKKCREMNTLMPDLVKSEDMSGYEGAIVLPPKCAMYLDNPIACVDYASLYPSIMISQNYSHDSKLWTKTYDLHGQLIEHTGNTSIEQTQYQYIDTEFDVLEYKKVGKSQKCVKTKIGTKICRWIQLPGGKKSIMPCILKELLQARAETRKKIKEIKDPFLRNILDKRQLGYKMTANSLYGQCGARTSNFYDKDIAASTTATGRSMIIYARDVIEKVFTEVTYCSQIHGKVRCNAEYIYGDTDSVFFTFHLTELHGSPIRGERALSLTIEVAKEVARICTMFLKSPMELSYEKTMMQFIILSKKRYAGMLYESDVTRGKLKFMGLAIKRRDSCDYLKDLYGDLLDILMRNDSNVLDKVKDVLSIVDTYLSNLKDGCVPLNKLIITKALRSQYKNPDQIAHNVLANRIEKRDPGNKPKPGERMKFIHIVPTNTTDRLSKVQGNKIETLPYIEQTKLKVDFIFYITNQLMKPIQQLLMMSWKEILLCKQYSLEKIKNIERDIAKCSETAADKYKSDIVKTQLFNTYINTIKVKNHNIHMNEFVTKYYTKEQDKDQYQKKLGN
jgi:DNA polymerase elongation subunit (family B)